MKYMELKKAGAEVTIIERAAVTATVNVKRGQRMSERSTSLASLDPDDGTWKMKDIGK